MLLAALTLLAQAQVSTISPHGVVLAPDPAVPYLATALHHPTVDWDPTRSRHMMAFATDQPGHANCPDGVTGLGLATSPGGHHWTVGPQALALPDPTSTDPGACRITEPALLFDAATDSLHVWFVAEGPGNVVSGIGHLELQLDAAGDPVWPPLYSGLVLPGTYREPSVIRVQSRYVMAFASYPNIQVATGPTPTGLTMDGSALDVDDYTVTWMEDEFWRGSMACRATGSFPLEIFAAGFDQTTGEWAIGKAVASPSNLTNWTLATAPLVGPHSGAEEEGFDFVLRGAADYVVYAGHAGQIEAGSFQITAAAGDPASKTCP